VFHQGNLARRAATLGAALTLAVAGLLAGGPGASAAALSGPVTLAGVGAVPATATLTYACTLAGGAVSLPAISVAAVLSAPATDTIGTAATVTLTTRAAPFTVPTGTTVPTFTQVTGMGTAQSTGMTAASLPLSGQSAALAAGSATQIPVVTVSGSATPSSAGSASVHAPPALTLTPLGATGLMFNCALITTTAVTVQITVTQAAVTPTAFTAPTYTCTITSGAHTVSRRDRIPIKLRDSGPSTVGSTNTVTLSSPGTALGGPFPAGTSTVGFSGALPVMGAQTDSVPLAGTMTDSGNGVFSMSGQLMLNAAGLDHILPPPRFTVTVHAAGVISVLVTCVLVTTMTATMPSSVAVQVTRATATGTGIVPFMAGATPSGAPNTGGGGSLHHASDLAGLAVGGAVLLAGLGIMLAGMRRRRRQSPA
jgi:hypothetical protein